MRYQYDEQVKEDEASLIQQQRKSNKVLVFQRLQMLRLFKSGQARSQAEAAALVGVSTRSVQTWWRLYQQQGLSGLLEITPTRHINLDAEQQQSLIAEAAKGGFSTINDIRSWVEQQFGILYTETGMWRIARRLGIKKKTARPKHVLQDDKKVVSFKKASLHW